jgi:hypothetical protein
MTTTTEHPGAAAAHEHPGPAEIRAALAEIGGGIENWDRMLDQLYAQAVESGSLAQLEKFLADSWRTVQLTRSGDLANFQPRTTRAQFASEWEARNGRAFPDAA